MINSVTLTGRLVRDPELKHTAGGLAVCTFTIAVDRRNKKQAEANNQQGTDFFRCKAWRQQADFVSQYIGKGRLVGIEGRIEINEVTTNGEKKFYTDIVCNNVTPLSSAKEGEGGSTAPAPAQAAPPPPPAPAATPKAVAEARAAAFPGADDLDDTVFDDE